MRLPGGLKTSALAILATAIGASSAAGRGADPAGTVRLEVEGQAPVRGRLEAGAGPGVVFVGADGRRRPLEAGQVFRFEGTGPPPSAGVPPFRVDLGLGQRLSGRLVSIDDRRLVLQDVVTSGELRVERAGVRSIVQRPGESVVFQDGFEALDSAVWTVVGGPRAASERKLAGASALRLPAGGASVTHALPAPVGSGRLETAFHDGGETAAGHAWFVDATFRCSEGPVTVRAVLGWSGPTLAVESTAGPALAVQRLARAEGWHRLAVRFGGDRCEVSVDGNELAHGKGFDGPLVQVRLASTAGADAPPAPAVAGWFDDLRLVRFAEPSGTPEVDVTQDEVRLTTGDQVYGQVVRAGPERTEARVDGRLVAFAWSETAGLYFRREARPGTPVSGLLARAEWRSASGGDPEDVDAVEGALVAVSDASVRLETPYCGTLELARDRISTLRVTGRGHRLVVDPLAHHLGDEISNTPPLLDPARPEGGVLERSFELPTPPTSPAWLVLDVLGVVGEGGDTPFSALVKKGELRTNVSINGAPFDNLNRFITTRNETPERIRIPVPKGLLKAGRNVVRFDQVGIASDPNYLDDLGVLGIALETADAPADAGRRD